MIMILPIKSINALKTEYQHTELVGAENSIYSFFCFFGGLIQCYFNFTNWLSCKFAQVFTQHVQCFFLHFSSLIGMTESVTINTPTDVLLLHGVQ